MGDPKFSESKNTNTNSSLENGKIDEESMHLKEKYGLKKAGGMKKFGKKEQVYEEI